MKDEDLLLLFLWAEAFSSTFYMLDQVSHHHTDDLPHSDPPWHFDFLNMRLFSSKLSTHFDSAPVQEKNPQSLFCLIKFSAEKRFRASWKKRIQAGHWVP